MVVGAVVSQTGMLAPLAGEYRKGLEVWLDDVNGAGGLLGRRVELRLLDDGSDAVRAGALYREMIQEGRTDLLIGPFGSAPAMSVAA